MRVIRTSQLALEPQLTTHAEEMFAVLSDPAIYEYENAPPSSLQWLQTRFSKLESRQSHDGREQWLNWVVRLGAGELIGYVQATVRADGADGADGIYGSALIAYEFASAFWGRGLAHEAAAAMVAELVARYQVRSFFAILKRENNRSMRLLQRLNFSLATPEQHVAYHVDADEALMNR